MNQTVCDLVAKYGAPASFEIELPDSSKWMIKGHATFSAQRAHNEAKEKFVKDLLGAKDAATKAQNNDLLPLPYRSVSELIDRVNLEAAFEIHSRVIAPEVFGPVEALQLCAAPQLVSYLLDQMTWGSANFLLELKAAMYAEAGKGSAATNSPD